MESVVSLFALVEGGKGRLLDDDRAPFVPPRRPDCLHPLLITLEPRLLPLCSFNNSSILIRNDLINRRV